MQRLAKYSVYEHNDIAEFSIHRTNERHCSPNAYSAGLFDEFNQSFKMKPKLSTNQRKVSLQFRLLLYLVCGWLLSLIVFVCQIPQQCVS